MKKLLLNNEKILVNPKFPPNDEPTREINIKQATKEIVGKGISGKVYFEVICDKQLTREEVINIQVMFNYHPFGYSCFRERSLLLEDKMYSITWGCSASCD